MASPSSPPRRRVSFTSSQGNTLAGTLTLAADSSNRACVILVHGFASSKDGFHLPALATALADAGYNSLRFDLTGNGDSEGTFRFAGYMQEVADIRSAKAYLEQMEGQRVVGLLGHSKGGDDVVLFASMQPNDIPIVINVAGRFDMQQGIAERFGADIFDRVKAQGGAVQLPAQREDGVAFTWQLTAQDLEERLTLDMAAAAASVPSDTKILTIHGTADSVIPVEDGRRFAAALPGHHLVEVQGADHNFTGGSQHVQQLVDAVVGFLRQHAPSV